MTSSADTPFFSIIIPTFNVAATLHACLDSIVGQTCNDFQVILVDGASKDDTLDIANSYSPKLGERLVIHSGHDEGPYDAMNHGVDLASGAWVYFLGADDNLYRPDTLAKVATFVAENQPSDLVYGDVIMRSMSYRYDGAFDLDRLQFQQNICHQAIFYRREIFAGIGPYNLRYRLWADWDFNIRCFANPTLVTRYMDLVIADYNDASGVSRQEDEELKKRLPVFIKGSAVSRRLASSKRQVIAAWRTFNRPR